MHSSQVVPGLSTSFSSMFITPTVTALLFFNNFAKANQAGFICWQAPHQSADTARKTHFSSVETHETLKQNDQAMQCSYVSFQQLFYWKKNPPRLLKKFLKGVGGEDLDPRMSRIRIIGRTEATTYPLTFTTPAIGSGSAVACEQAVGFAGAWHKKNLQIQGFKFGGPCQNGRFK